MRSVADPEALARLIVRLGALRSDTPRLWGTLTPGEVLCHLADATASVLGSKRPGQGRSRPFIKWLALYSPLPWAHGAKTPAHVDPRAGGTRPGDFEEDRRRAIEGLRQVAAAPAAAFPAAHALFGLMTDRDWRRWAYRHTDHHLKQFGQ